RTERTVANDYTVRKDNKFFQLLADQPVRVKPKDKVLMEMRLDGSRHIRFKDLYLAFKDIPKPQYRPFYAGKIESVAAIASSKPQKPAKDHPWRKSYLGIRRAPSAAITVHRHY
ncbi:MAG: hypothetical protein Q8O90_11570, partial [Elusimicrobiota bacterium]|nr:hypothetical protein [Elusimicrobiota bacterium]